MPVLPAWAFNPRIVPETLAVAMKDRSASYSFAPALCAAGLIKKSSLGKWQ